MLLWRGLGSTPTLPDRFRPLRADPRVTGGVAEEGFPAQANALDEVERRRRYDQMAAQMPNIAQYQGAIPRQIPVVVLERISARH